MKVADADIARYRDDGIVCLRDVMPQGWIDLLRDAVEVAMAQPGPHAEEYAKGGGRFFGDLDLWQRHAPFRRFVLESPAAEIAGWVMGPRRSTSSTTSFW